MSLKVAVGKTALGAVRRCVAIAGHRLKMLLGKARAGAGATSVGLVFIAVSAELGGCAVGPNYHAPQIPVPDAFITAGSPAKAGAGVDLSKWWEALGDRELNSLIERAIHANPDIEIALTRLQEVRTQEAAHLGAALPTISASAAGGRGTGSDLSRAGAQPALREADNKGNLAQIRQVAGVSASWELDLFGGYRRAIEAGRYDVAAATADRDVVLISVVADVARNYVDIRGLQSRLAILRNNIAAAMQSRDFQRIRFERGLTNELDLQLAQRELATLRAQLPVLTSQVSVLRGDLAVLLGEFPEKMAGELDKSGDLPKPPATVPTGIPPDLLRRRPDVRAAERQLAGATARIGLATAALFPHLVLSGGVGAQSGGIGLQGSHIWAFGPSLYWPVLDFGQLDAQVDSADLQAHEKLIAYKKSIIAAVRDTDNAFAGFSAQEQRLEALGEARTASERALNLAQQRYERGLTDFLNVVDAEQQQFSLEDQYTAAEQNAADAFITLCQALGGGWEHYQQAPAIRKPLPAVIAGPRRLVMRDGSSQ